MLVITGPYIIVQKIPLLQKFYHRRTRVLLIYQYTYIIDHVYDSVQGHRYHRILRCKRKFHASIYGPSFYIIFLSFIKENSYNRHSMNTSHIRSTPHSLSSINEPYRKINRVIPSRFISCYIRN